MISLFATQQAYGRAALPQFTVDVVNTARRACAFDAGAHALRLVIRSGRVRVWSSADCARGAASDVSHLQRGVPFVTEFTWSRRGSSPGCRGARPSAAPGTYTATAVSPAGRSRTAVFVLR